MTTYLTRRQAVFATLGLSLIGGSALAEPTAVTLDEVKAGLADGSMILIDVREKDEFDAGHIPGAKLLPLSSFDPAQLPKDAGKRVVLYCRSGRRAKEAAATAEAAGRNDLFLYAGSMNEWTAAGAPVEK